MSRLSTLPNRPVGLRRAVTAAAAAMIAAPVACATPAHAGPAGPEVPSTIAVVGDFKPYLVGHAIGWQVHTCPPQRPATPGPSRVLRDPL